MQVIALEELVPNPRNPRLVANAEVVEQIAASLRVTGAMDEAFALLVRPVGEAYEVIAGHHRLLAAKAAGLAEVPCHVRELSDADAYMLLVTSNAQSELHSLEVGLHALGSGLSRRRYAEVVGKKEGTLKDMIESASVAIEVWGHMPPAKHRDSWRSLAEVHAAPRWLWRALVAALPETVERTREAVARVAKAVGPPGWADVEAVAMAVVSGVLGVRDVERFGSLVAAAEAEIVRVALDVDLHLEMLAQGLADAKPSTVSAVQGVCGQVLAAQAEVVRAKREEELRVQRLVEERAAKLAKYRQVVSLAEWTTLSDDERVDLLAYVPGDGPRFNKQETADIEWAQWSWNPVTGCKHECPYCYARDIAEQAKMAKYYPHGFAPALRPASLSAPLRSKLPQEAATDARYRNVFTCSMADLFGRWVPAEWVNAVLGAVRQAPQWHFLFLTKFPKRMTEFELPANGWFGTTVDLQARVAAAESAFERVQAVVKWLSLEPMLEPLTFKRLDLFDWVVVGGASASSKTPVWHPPFAWIRHLLDQVREAEQRKGAAIPVYAKTNLLGSLVRDELLGLPLGLPVPQVSTVAPTAFNYLGGE